MYDTYINEWDMGRYYIFKMCGLNFCSGVSGGIEEKNHNVR